MIHRAKSPLILQVERLVYGSLPSRDRGYELLGRSPGCTPDLVAQVIAACRRYGQPPNAAASRPAWFALRLPAGPWAIVTIDPQGADDQGRPGALIFDATLVPASSMTATGFNIAAFVAKGQTIDWPTTAVPAVLATIRSEVDHLPVSRPNRTLARGDSEDPRLAAIVAALGKRRRIALEADAPIDDLVRTVWERLGPRVRRRSSVATWAFGAENRFDLMVVPRLAGVALDPSYLPAEVLEPPKPPEPGSASPMALGMRPPWVRLHPRHARPTLARAIDALGTVRIGLGGMALVVVAALLWASGLRERSRLILPMASSAPGAPEAPDPTEDLAPAARTRALRGLRELAQRFSGFELGDPGDPSAFLGGFADALHYQGPLLSEAELGRLRAASAASPAAARALRWHEQIQGLRRVQPWPSRLADLPLAGQLRALGRSFHLDPATAPEAVPDALMAHLARAEAVSPSPLGADFPALGPYSRFLARLPRRDEPAEPGRTDR